MVGTQLGRGVVTMVTTMTTTTTTETAVTMVLSLENVSSLATIFLDSDFKIMNLYEINIFTFKFENRYNVKRYQVLYNFGRN